MMPMMKELDWTMQFEMYAGTAACLLVLIFVVGGLVFVVKLVLRGSWHHWWDNLWPRSRS